MISNQAIIHPSAQIGHNVEIGPWAYIGENVSIGEGTKIGPHVVIKGPTRIGKNNNIFQFSSIGEVSQAQKTSEDGAFLEIGDNNTIREFVTINRGGSKHGSGTTKIGNDNWIMAYVHIAHDCLVGNNVIFASYSGLAGHVTVEDHVIISAYAAIHQFCLVGGFSFVAKATYVNKDVLPFIMVAGYEATAIGLNIEGLKRKQFSQDTLNYLRKAYRIIFRKGLLVKEALEELGPLQAECVEVHRMVEFLKSSTRGIIR